jgi:hypothetical protein
MIDETGAEYKSVTIENLDGSKTVIKPGLGQHLILLSWKENYIEGEESIDEQPGVMLTHCSTEICARMFDRVIRQFPGVWDGLQKLWAWYEKVEEFNRRRTERKWNDPGPGKAH